MNPKCRLSILLFIVVGASVVDWRTFAEKQVTKLVKCMDVSPASLCLGEIKIRPKRCSQDFYFGRFRCCKTCAKHLKVNLTEDGAFTGQPKFPYYHPKCPNATDAVKATSRESWTSWCELWTEEDPKEICEIGLMQFRCYKTCNVECANDTVDEEKGET
ncbi:hypothetical protein Tsp_00494 [Trichinella spiralis]|uniref:Uncharacterized protein n=1 Tax=Trichinella spiralis TaxID=6334 RepID=E5S9S1_TRISP|nr:hypothetical protein Tsp_00494 [Trichinella spiralis]KRY32221.1 hypothetical protein T01_10634 [Trichinella spiralis]